MAKITVKAVTRLQKFLAAIAGDGAAPNPITDKEKLLHNIAENVNNGGGTGGGVLVVNMTFGEDAATLDKTWAETNDAPVTFVSRVSDGEGKDVGPVCRIGTTLDFQTGTITAYFVDVVIYGATMADAVMVRFSADAEDGVLTYAGE